ncbi:MAG TPA: aminodeoxychorismate lyase, partial [Gammaproteobacteria bacterium]
MDTLVNGAFSDSVSVYDRGLAYGDGVFETIAVHKGESLLLAAHMQRLQQGCRRLGIPVPAMEQCCTEIEQLCSGRTGILKLVVTRGAGTRGYAAPGDIQPTRILLFSPWLAYPEHFYKQGIQTAICSIRVAEQEQLAGLKHLNRLENVLAAQEILGSNLQEGLMLDCKDRIIECTRSNIFFVKDGELHTPALDRCGID